MAASVKLNPPQFKGKTYERYKTELAAWREVTTLEKKQQGIAVALTLPEDDSTGIRETVFEEMDLAVLKADDGFEKLVEFFDKKLGKDDLADSLEKYEDFDDFVRDDTLSVSDYITRFDQKYNRIVKKGMKLPSEILAFQLLRRAKITKEEKLLVLTGMDYSKKDTLYEQAKLSLKKFKGDGPSSAGCDSAKSKPSIKLEPAFLAEHEEALVAAGYVHQSKFSQFGGNRRGKRKPGRGRGSLPDLPRGDSQNSRRTRRMNPTGSDGNILTCLSCGSYRHMLSECPDSWENLSKKESEKAVLYTGSIKCELALLTQESRNCAVLDSACSSTVCGERWMQCFLDSLDEDKLPKVVRSAGGKVFKFGGGETLESKVSYQIPVVLAGRNVTIRTDVVTSDIPLLLSLQEMKNLGVKLDLVNDTAEIFGKQIVLNHTSSGHYCVSVDGAGEKPVAVVCAVRLHELSDCERRKALLKLHRQFAHPPAKKLIALMNDAGVWRDEFKDDLDKIYSDCKLCKVYTTTPPRPVVSLPMARNFNEKVAMDLKKWRDQWILHLIDMWSRLTISAFIRRKKPSEVLDKIMMRWVGAGFGVMQGILSDNGGEFSAEEVREVASILNVQVCTTAGESPFQNGLCERVHAVTDSMLLKLEEQYPDTDLEVLLCWANMARNSLQMWHGFSSYQLVFGRNPNLPNIMTDGLPALQGTTTSEILVKHLNALHASREAFIETEADERIRRALRGKVRASEQTFSHGDRVYYKREGHERWLGPGKVVFQDGRVVFVRHGGTFVRVSPNRLVKAGLEFAVSDEGVSSQPSCSPVGSDVKHPGTQTYVKELIAPETVVQDNRATVADLSDENQSVERQDPSLLRKDDKIQFKTKSDDEWTTATVLSRAGKVSGKYNSRYNVRNDSGIDSSVDLKHVSEWKKADETEVVNVVLIPRCRHGDQDCVNAKMEELQKLKDFDTYELVDDVGQTKITTAWVLSKKGDKVRARLVARGFEEVENVQKDSPTISKCFVRLILAIAVSRGWVVKTTDIKSAFLQGKQLDREVFLLPPKEASEANGKIWKLKHCLYGLNDAARQFYLSVKETLLKLGCVQSKLDPALFFVKRSGRLIGVVASHIDDFLHAGEPEFETEIMERLRERFLAGRIEDADFSYVGFQIVQDKDGIVLDMKNYVDSFECVPISPQRASLKLEALSSEECTQLRSIVGRLNWVVQGSRPDLAFEMIDLSTRFKKANVTDLLRAHKAVRKLKSEASCLRVVDLGDFIDWRLLVFSDAALANLSDGVSSTSAHIVLLLGRDSRCCPLSWQANKIKRVVRSTIAAEALSLLEAIEDAIFQRSQIEDMLGQHVESLPIIAVIDNRSVVEAVHSTKMVEDKRLRLDISAIKQTMEESKVSCVWCPGNLQLANCLTKKGASALQLLSVLQSGKIDIDRLIVS